MPARKPLRRHYSSAEFNNGLDMIRQHSASMLSLMSAFDNRSSDELINGSPNELIDFYARYIRGWLAYLLEFLPSQSSQQELCDLFSLTKLSKQLLKIPGNLASDVYALIYRKAMSLRHSKLATMPSRSGSLVCSEAGIW